MGRSFDRGGQSRKERSRGKRRAFQQAERDKEMRDAAMQARREAIKPGAGYGKQTHTAPATVYAAAAQVELPSPVIAAAALEQKPSGFISRVFGRIFGRAA
jgi:hypothetical protein